MNRLETNALRIAELMGYKPFGERMDGLPMGYTLNNSSWATCDIIPKFIDYNGLMPIVFECAFSGLMDFEIFSFDRKIFVEIETIDGENPINTEPEFIEAIQLAVIKYLELK